MFSGGWQHHRNSRQQELSMNRSIEPSTTSPPPSPPHTHPGEMGNLNLKCQVDTFLIVWRNTHGSWNWSSSRGKMPLLWTIGSSKRASTNIAVFFEVIYKEFGWLFIVDQFSNSVYQKLEHLFLGRGIWLSNMAHELGIWTAFWPCGAGNLKFGIWFEFKHISVTFWYQITIQCCYTLTLGLKVASWMFYNVAKKDNSVLLTNFSLQQHFPHK